MELLSGCLDLMSTEEGLCLRETRVREIDNGCKGTCMLQKGRREGGGGGGGGGRTEAYGCVVN